MVALKYIIVDTYKIDEAINNWMNTINEAIQTSTPLSQYTCYPHPKTSDYLQLLTNQYNQLQNNGIPHNEDARQQIRRKHKNVL